MLEQALSCSQQADVEFLFDDGAKLVKGHRGLLCSASREFEGMFQSGMVEDSTGVVRVRHVSRASFKGFLEWVYLGECGSMWFGEGVEGGASSGNGAGHGGGGLAGGRAHLRRPGDRVAVRDDGEGVDAAEGDRVRHEPLLLVLLAHLGGVHHGAARVEKVLGHDHQLALRAGRGGKQRTQRAGVGGRGW